MKQIKFKRLTKITLIIFAFIILFGLGCIGQRSTYYMEKPVIEDTEIEYVVPAPEINIQDSLETALLAEISTYIQKQAPKSHGNLPEYLMNAGLEHNIDLCFMMAQTQLETNFGTLGAGRESSRRSLFGVSIRRYLDYESAINDYCLLLHKSYLGRGRTEEHLLNKYTTHSGARYAENPRYEVELRSTYKHIVRSTNIKDIQAELKKLS